MPPIGQIRVDLVADTAKFTSGFQAAQTILGGFGRHAKRELAAFQSLVKGTASSVLNMKTAIAGAAAAFGVIKFGSSLDNVAEKIDQLGKASKRLGVSVEDLSVFSFAAGQAGVEFEQFASLASKALKNVASAVKDGEKTMKLGRFNVALTDTTGQIRSLTDLLPEIAKGLGSVRSSAEQLRLAEKIFGRGGGDAFVTLLKDFPELFERWEETQATVAKNGNRYTDDQVKKLTAYRDAVNLVHKAWEGVQVKLMTEIAPAITGVLETLAERTAAIPRTVAALTKGISLASGDGEDARKAGAILQEVAKDTVDLLYAGAEGAGNIFVAVVKAGVQVIGTAMAIEFSKGLRDYLPETLKKAIGLDASVGSEARVTFLSSQLKGLSDKEAKIANRSEERGGEFGLEAQRARQELSELLNRIEGKPKTVEKARVILAQLIDTEEKMLRLNEGASGQLYAKLFTDNASDIAKAVAAARDQLTDPMYKLDIGLGTISNLYGPPAQPGASQASRPPVAPFLTVLRDAISNTADAAVAATPDFTKLFEAIQKGYFKVQDLAGDFDVRALKAAGLDAEAERLKLQLTHQRESRDLYLEMGDAAKGLHGNLLKVEEAELRAFDQKPIEELKKKVDALSIRLVPEGRLNEDLETINKALEAGVIAEDTYGLLAERIEEHLEKIGDKADTLANRMKSAIEGFGDDAAHAFADLVVDGEASFEQIAKSWIKTLVATASQKLIFGPIFDGIGLSVGKALGNAHGNAFSGGRLLAFASGGVVTRPTLFPMASGAGLMGEAGPEAIMPLTRIGGDLGVKAAGNGVVVNVIDQRSSGRQPDVSSTTGPDGSRQISILLRDEIRRGLSDGAFDKQFSTYYGVNRKGARR